MNIPDLYDHSSSLWTCQDMNIWTCVKVTQVISTTISGPVIVNVVSRRSTLKQHLATEHRGLQQQEPNRWGRIAPEIS